MKAYQLNQHTNRLARFAPLLDRLKQPLGYAAGDENLRRYVGNNPVNAIDPSGQICPVCPPTNIKKRRTLVNIPRPSVGISSVDGGPKLQLQQFESQRAGLYWGVFLKPHNETLAKMKAAGGGVAIVKVNSKLVRKNDKNVFTTQHSSDTYYKFYWVVRNGKVIAKHTNLSLAEIKGTHVSQYLQVENEQFEDEFFQKSQGAVYNKLSVEFYANDSKDLAKLSNDDFYQQKGYGPTPLNEIIGHVEDEVGLACPTNPWSNADNRNPLSKHTAYADWYWNTIDSPHASYAKATEVIVRTSVVLPDGGGRQKISTVQP